jgi:hypothetical protein
VSRRAKRGGSPRREGRAMRGEGGDDVRLIVQLVLFLQYIRVSTSLTIARSNPAGFARKLDANA